MFKTKNILRILVKIKEICVIPLTWQNYDKEGTIDVHFLSLKYTTIAITSIIFVYF
jgi:hypothetical protein